jgi:hypothetical protein
MLAGFFYACNLVSDLLDAYLIRSKVLPLAFDEPKKLFKRPKASA